MAFPFPTFPIQGTRLVSEFRGDYNQMLDAVLQSFTGPDEPSPTFAGMFWVDTSVSPKLLKQRNSGNASWVVRAHVDTDYGGVLPLTGGAMSGAIAMGGNAITGLPLGSGDAPARYSDVAAYAPLAGATFTAIPELPAVDPTTDNQAARKAYVDDRAIAGGAFTGQITMSTPPTAATHVTTKTYTDGLIDVHNHDGTAGRGPVLQAENLGASGRSAGDQIRAKSDGSVEWYGGNPFEILDEPIEAVRGTFGDFSWTQDPYVWNTVDLGAHAPAEARYALVIFSLQNPSGSVWAGDTLDGPSPIYWRRTGTTTGFPSSPTYDEQTTLRTHQISSYATTTTTQRQRSPYPGFFPRTWVPISYADKELDFALHSDGTSSSTWHHHDQDDLIASFTVFGRA